MSVQFKIDQTPSSDQAKKTTDDEKTNKRPNIDHLLKRISLERKEEKRNNLLMLTVGIIAIGIVSLVIV
ncbi:hypothetical protein N9J56_01265 [Pelagibacteraceae bacterium]|nr:hypothetical protein [Pelagibacteraceae bacterium]